MGQFGGEVLVDSAQMHVVPLKYRASGRSELFEAGRRKALASVGEIPMSESIRRFIRSNNLIDIPTQVNNIKIFEFANEENLPDEYKLLLDLHGYYKDGILYRAINEANSVDAAIANWVYLNSVFNDLFRVAGVGPASSEIVNHYLHQDKVSDSLVFVSGHGGGKPWTVGERKNIKQPGLSDGNRIPVQAVVDKISNTQNACLIVVAACNDERLPLKAHNCPIIYTEGEASRSSKHVYCRVAIPRAGFIESAKKWIGAFVRH